MYSIEGLKTIFDIMAYTASALKEVGYTDSDVEYYISKALDEDSNLGIINVSKDWIDECNKVCTDIYPNKEDYTWRDSYYSQTFDDEENIDMYDYSGYDNMVDDVGSDDEEAYEGFSSCKKYKWDCTDCDDYFYDNVRIKDYYENMRSEYDCEPSYDPFDDENQYDF